MYQHLYYRRVFSFSLIMLAIILLHGCDPAFSPIEENNRHYSIFGYLNASADTQFVRIEKVRDSLFFDTPTKLDARVKLTNVTTGQSVFFKDSLFQYPFRGKVHNYYSTSAINPTETYRLEVVEEGTKTKAEVVIPHTFPTPELLSGSRLKITDIDRLIGVKMIYSVYANCSNPPNKDICPEEPTINQHSFQHLEDTLHVGNGVIHAQIGQSEDLQEIKKQYSKEGITLVKVEVVVAAGSPSWPDFIGLEEEEIAVPGNTSNIEGGVGLLGGVVTDTVVVYSNKPQFNP